MNKISRLIAGSALIASILMPAAVHAQEPVKGGTLVIGSTQKPRHLNPAVQSGVATAVPGAQIFATPLRFDAEWNPQPYLAESWEVPMMENPSLCICARAQNSMMANRLRPGTSPSLLKQ